MEPKALLLDEPTTGLDEDARNTIASILNTLAIGYVIVSHEYEFLAATTDKIYSMDAGKIHYNGAADSLHGHSHKHLLKKHPHRV